MAVLRHLYEDRRRRCVQPIGLRAAIRHCPRADRGDDRESSLRPALGLVHKLRGNPLGLRRLDFDSPVLKNAVATYAADSGGFCHVRSSGHSRQWVGLIGTILLRRTLDSPRHYAGTEMPRRDIRHCRKCKAPTPRPPELWQSGSNWNCGHSYFP